MFINASKELKGSIFILFSAFMYATLPILVKLAYGAGLGPGSTLLLRYIFSFILLALFIKVVKHDHILSLSPAGDCSGNIFNSFRIVLLFCPEYSICGFNYGNIFYPSGSGGYLKYIDFQRKICASDFYWSSVSFRRCCPHFWAGWTFPRPFFRRRFFRSPGLYLL